MQPSVKQLNEFFRSRSDERIDLLVLHGFSRDQVFGIFSAWLCEASQRRVFFFSDVAAWPISDLESKVCVLPKEVELLKRYAWQAVRRHVEYIAAEDTVDARRWFAEFSVLLMGAQSILASMCHQVGKHIANMCCNLPRLPHALSGSALANTMRNIPAVVCGAGRSVSTHRKWLQNATDKAVILAGGSALNALVLAGMRPTIGAVIDPDSPIELFLDHALSEIPFLYQNRASAAVIEKIRGEKIWLPDGTGCGLERWLLEEMGMISEEFDAGWNVATCCLQFALLLGCNPIVLVGVDLGGGGYATGVTVPSRKTVEVLWGEEAYSTRPDFILAADWIARIAAAYPAVSILTLPHEGLRISGVKNVIPEQCVFPVRVSSPQQEWAHILANAPRCTVGIYEAERVIERLRQDSAIALDRVEQMLDILRAWHPRDPAGSAEYTICEIELQQSAVFRERLEFLWRMWAMTMSDTSEGEPYEGFAIRMQQLVLFREQLRAICHAARTL